MKLIQRRKEINMTTTNANRTESITLNQTFKASTMETRLKKITQYNLENNKQSNTNE